MSVSHACGSERLCLAHTLMGDVAQTRGAGQFLIFGIPTIRAHVVSKCTGGRDALLRIVVPDRTGKITTMSRTASYRYSTR